MEISRRDFLLTSGASVAVFRHERGGQCSRTGLEATCEAAYQDAGKYLDSP